MSGYRRGGPAFCRGCGAAWDPGAQSCAGCGESLEREQTYMDPRAGARLKAAMIATGVLIGVRWIPLLSDTSFGASNAWLAAGGALCAVALLTARLWLPARGAGAPAESHWLRTGGGLMIHGLGLAVGVVLACAWGLVAQSQMGDSLWFYMVTPEAELYAAGVAYPLIGLAVASVVFEEAFFRGLLFDALTPFGGKQGAGIATTVLFSMMFFSPAYLLIGAAAAAVRAYSGSIWPAVVLRIGASIAWLGWVAHLLG